ncbi:MAG TPA: imidazole glycerol phosphate synthase subunit HisH [Pyrinomonadaceae bacterium]|nr:imidazole glycerol phosphate synthase subunit HisH [Pyrinomonadaceae bacterium]
MKVAIVKYNAGNIQSVTNAVRRFGLDPVITDSGEELKSADKVIFPGVGEASSAMDYLRSKNLDTAIKSLTRPVLAVCLGMQLLCKYSDENEAECLGILPYKVQRFPANRLKIPHMGWNNISSLKSSLFENVADDSRMYFVHSYFVESVDETIAHTAYGSEFSAAVQHENFYGVQFHPEKSGQVGAKLLENFLKI